MFNKLKNLWKLASAEITTAPDGKRAIINFPEKKPDKRPAVIIEDSPMDLFPNEEEKL